MMIGYKSSPRLAQHVATFVCGSLLKTNKSIGMTNGRWRGAEHTHQPSTKSHISTLSAIRTLGDETSIPSCVPQKYSLTENGLMYGEQIAFPLPSPLSQGGEAWHPVAAIAIRNAKAVSNERNISRMRVWQLASARAWISVLRRV